MAAVEIRRLGILAVYHRPDQSSVAVLSLYDLNGTTPEPTVEPGMHCDGLTRYRNVILFKTGTSGGGTTNIVYDHNLKEVGSFNAYQFFLDFDEGIAVGEPMYGPDQGVFRVFRLTDRIQVGAFDFSDRMDENYICTGMTKTGTRTFTVEVQGVETDHKEPFVTTIR